MNFLLLLSALLSALSGVGASVRAPEVAQAVASRLEKRTAPESPRPASTRPEAVLPMLAVVAAGATIVSLPPTSPEPLWASRRRE